MAKLTTSVFKVLFRFFQNYRSQYCYFFGINTFSKLSLLTTLNNEGVAPRTKDLNKRGKGESIISFVLSTVYVVCVDELCCTVYVECVVCVVCVVYKCCIN